ncbi:24-methylenesterol C-methyltransferase 3 [Linum perenne]
MLCETAVYLTKGGEMRIFSPMYMVLCRKPVQETAPLN